MTTNTLAAIRERADKREYRIVYNERSDEEQVDPQVYADIAALLAIVDELTARAEAAEAALRAITEDGADCLMQYPDAFDRVQKIAADALAAHANGESAGNGGA